MKKIILIVTAALLTVACSKSNSNEPKQEIKSLAGTKWKLTAFVDVENNTHREPDHGSATGDTNRMKSMFTLSFDNEGVFGGRAIGNGVGGEYSVDYTTNTLFLISNISTKVGEPTADSYFYWRFFNGSFVFKLYSQTLHILYDDDKKYLEFNKIGDSNEY